MEKVEVERPHFDDDSLKPAVPMVAPLGTKQPADLAARIGATDPKVGAWQQQFAAAITSMRKAA